MRSALKIAKRQFHSSSARRAHDVVILSAARTPIGSFQGALASVPATELGAIASREAIKRAGLTGADINEVILGNVCGAGLGQAPSTQIAHKAGIPNTVPTTSINKVCSSGMKSTMFAAQSIMTGHNQVVLSGGFESMSNIPHYLMKARTGYGYGHGELVDGLIKDGLTDAFDNSPMGICAEVCAEQYKFSRQEQDKYALESYRRAVEAQKQGWTVDEIVPVTVTGRKGAVTVSLDEEPGKLLADKVPTLRPAFKKDGTVTAANASKLNDGACSLVVASSTFAQERGLKPIARILGFADAQKAPVEFTTAPALAIPKALANAGLKIEDVDYFEINEAFSVVGMVNAQLLNLDPSKLNAFGGAVALGHPIGVSGARIIQTVINILKKRDGRIGVAAICNGGGGASAIVVERL